MFSLSSGTAFAASAVPVPPEYVYNPKLGPRHDFCTWSSDEPVINNKQLKRRTVDFRGPCARHDLCYDRSANKAGCDNQFKRDLDQQCDFTFQGDTTGYLDYCRGRAQAYYAGVVAGGTPGAAQ